MVNYLAKPWLVLPASFAHHWAPKAIKILSPFSTQKTPEWRSFTWKNLEFKNPLGISGGVDKDAENVSDWSRLGAGFVEVGTITPRPQPGNSGKVVDRANDRLAVWNRMGFPSKGLEYSYQKLLQLSRPYPVPVFANIGKNASTPLEQAAEDYLICMKKLMNLVDGFVVNISSPNTVGLRELLKPQNLAGFLKPLLEELSASPVTSKPLLLKLSPDMSREDLESALDASCELGIDGWILTNTSVQIREGLRFPKEGGVSGLPLRERSAECLRWAVEHLGPRKQGKLLISSGGILSAEEILRRLDLGADLVQVYAALIFEGPTFFRKVARQLSRLPHAAEVLK